MDVERLWRRSSEFLGVRYPIICGAMTWISDHRLVADVSREGAFASPAAGSDLHVVPVRAIRNRGTEEFADLQVDLLMRRRRGKLSQSEAQHLVEEYWMGALQRAVQQGDVERGSLMAGQSVGLAGGIQSLRDIIGELVEDARRELDRTHGRWCSLGEEDQEGAR